ncbi:hypothetical protein B0H11DRAFT_2227817 [Mycena galericulata]|nr:hypothetical protein B0H11DRAFT_2227817 [Mycena galericulata]
MAPRRSQSFPPITSHPLESIQEMDLEETSSTSAYESSPSEETDASSSPIIFNPSTIRAGLSSPSTVPRKSSNYRMASLESIEEYEIEDDDAEDFPPVSSSPGRSSDSFFPHHDFSSSPQTSDHDLHSPDTHILDPDAPFIEAATIGTPNEEDFGSKLNKLLVIAARQRERGEEMETDEAARSLSVTPDYVASPGPPLGDNLSQCTSVENSFGPRSYSWSSSSSGSTGVESCHCSDCDQSESTSRSQSISSSSTYTGYAADLDSSPSHLHVAPSSLALMAQFRYIFCTSSTLVIFLTPGLDSDLQSTTPTPKLVTDSFLVPSPFRLAKRSYSSLHEDTTHSNSYKKSKSNNSRSSSFSSRSKTSAPTDKTTLSRVPASLRKSLSLRSEASQSYKPPSPPSADLIPTAPNTPCQPKTGRSIVDDVSLTIPFDVPIIAPPPEHVARLALTKEAAAKIRIGNLLAREGRFRAADKLDEVGVNVIASAAYAQEERELERLRWEHTLGVGPELRREVVEWILEVLPKKSMYPPISTASRLIRASSLESSCSMYSSGGYDDEMKPDLIDQLLTSPETRFHAAYMFVRYFYLVMGDSEERQKVERMQQAAAAAQNEMPYDQSIPPDGWGLVAWDCCLACLAISVKIHRDVLEPLEPILSWEFEAIAPHQLTYEDLEIAQRDVLSAFEYSLGGTPQPIMDELWTALPSLQQLLHFEGGWKHAQKEAWCLLFDAVAGAELFFIHNIDHDASRTEPDILKFPVSLLTVAALSEALVTALVSKYKYDASVNGQVTRRRPRKSQSDIKKVEEKVVDKAEREIEGVVQDIQAIVGISDARLKVCRRWLRAASKHLA